LRKYLLGLQYSQAHPFNGAHPGGWGWNGGTGSVPDADDTPGAILALLELSEEGDHDTAALFRGCDWLVRLQNSDGGLPTFCRGWGRLPFDQSCADLTGHAFAAVAACRAVHSDSITSSRKKIYERFLDRALHYLEVHQNADGSWFPLWFGNQNNAQHRNPVYGTARVMVYLASAMEHVNDASQISRLKSVLARALDFIVKNCNSDGGWGARRGVPSTQEESALALSALVSAGYAGTEIGAGFSWLLQSVRKSGIAPSAIGLYFASLWYDEKLYPHIFMVDAGRRFVSALQKKVGTIRAGSSEF